MLQCLSFFPPAHAILSTHDTTARSSLIVPLTRHRCKHLLPPTPLPWSLYVPVDSQHLYIHALKPDLHAGVFSIPGKGYGRKYGEPRRKAQERVRRSDWIGKGEGSGSEKGATSARMARHPHCSSNHRSFQH